MNNVIITVDKDIVHGSFNQKLVLFGVNMNYFNEIKFIGGGIYSHCGHGCIDNRFSSFYSLQYDREGTIRYNIKGQERIILVSPVIYLLHPDKWYQYGLVNPDENWHHSWLAFNGKRAKAVFENGFAKLAPHGYIKIHNPIEVGALFDDIVRLSALDSEEGHCQAVICLERLLTVLAFKNRDSGSFREHYSYLADLGDKINEYPLNDWDFRDIARRHGISYSHFRKQFKKCTGLAPHDFVMNARIKWCINEMKNGGRAIKQIADECGYRDPAYFSKIFKKRMGLSPREYRRSLYM